MNLIELYKILDFIDNSTSREWYALRFFIK